MSSIDRLQAYYNAAAYLESKEERDNLAKQLELDLSEIEQRTAGLRAQDEFILILHYLASSKHFLSFDEAASVLSGSYQPDLFVQTQSGNKLLIEIKSTDKERFSISGGNLSKRIAFAADLGFPLYFALKQQGLWLLVSSSYLQNNSGKLNVEQDFQNSELGSFFGSKLYAIPSGIRITSEYTKIAGQGMDLEHREYGRLVAYKFYYADKLIFQAVPPDFDGIGHSMVLERLHDHMANTHMEIKPNPNGNTETIESLDETLLLPDYSFYMSSIAHTLRTGGNTYDATTLFKELLQTKSPFVTITALRDSIKFLVDHGVPIEEHETVPKEYLET